jgi:hypothetical protein
VRSCPIFLPFLVPIHFFRWYTSTTVKFRDFTSHYMHYTDHYTDHYTSHYMTTQTTTQTTTHTTFFFSQKKTLELSWYCTSHQNSSLQGKKKKSLKKIFFFSTKVNVCLDLFRTMKPFFFVSKSISLITHPSSTSTYKLTNNYYDIIQINH